MTIFHYYGRVRNLTTMFRKTSDRFSLRKSKVREIEIQKRLELETGGGHQSCPTGIPDIVSDDSLIEIKTWRDYKYAFGQLLLYRKYFPGRQPRIHFFGKRITNLKALKDIYEAAKEQNIVITEEPEKPSYSLNTLPAPLEYPNVDYKGIYDRYLSKADSGLIQLCAEKASSGCVCIDPKQRIYLVWDDMIKLWVKKDRLEIIEIEMGKLTHLLDQIIKCFKNDQLKERSNKDSLNLELLEEVNNILKELTALRVKYTKITGFGQIENMLSRKLYVVNTKYNLDSSIIPIRRGLMLDTSTKLVRERTDKDLFTFECDVEYDPTESTKDVEDYIGNLFVEKEPLQAFLGNTLGSRSSFKQTLLIKNNGNNQIYEFVTLLCSVFGEYATIANNLLITKSKQDKRKIYQEYIPALKNRKLCFFLNPSFNNGSMDDYILNKITKGIQIAEVLDPDGKPFSINCLVIVICDQLPLVQMDSFDAQVLNLRPPNRDHTKFSNPALLNWLLEGCEKTVSLNKKAMTTNTATSTPLKFIYEAAVDFSRYGISSNEISTKCLYKLYDIWCECNGFKTETINFFSRQLRTATDKVALGPGRAGTTIVTFLE